MSDDKLRDEFIEILNDCSGINGVMDRVVLEDKVDSLGLPWLQRTIDQKVLEARLDELRDWGEACNGDTSEQKRHARLCKYHRRIAELERDLEEMTIGPKS